MTEAEPERRFAPLHPDVKNGSHRIQITPMRRRGVGVFCPELYITKRLPWEVCHKHRNIRREIPAGTIPLRRDGSGVRSL